MSKMADLYLDLIESLTTDPETQDYLLEHCDEFASQISPETVEYLANGGKLKLKIVVIGKDWNPL